MCSRPKAQRIHRVGERARQHSILQPRRLFGLRDQVNCTGSRWRRINRWENGAVLDRMAKRLAARPDILNVRRETVEHPFGSIKQWMNQGAFLMRRLQNVRAELSLTALAYNLRCAITLVGVPAMIRAAQA